jgi:hypothetical protein
MYGLTIEAGLADLKGRYDLYGPIHKGLRRAQGEMLTRLGTADFADPAALGTLGELRRLLELGAAHIGHEETHVHATIARAEANRVDLLERQHESHRETHVRLEALIRAIEQAAPAERPSLGRRLYLVFGVHIAHDLLHMFEEETVAAPTLWATQTDTQIAGMEHAIISSLPPEKNMAFLSLMIPAVNRDERFALLSGVKAGAPKEAFNVVMEVIARPNLSREDFSDLNERLNRAEMQTV